MHGLPPLPVGALWCSLPVETFGPYELLRKLATGGMGQVYLARKRGPVGFQKPVVVKRLLPHLSEDEEFLQMFRDEAVIAALLTHPNIAQIYELGDVDGVLYIAMEYVHGESVNQVNARSMQRKGGLPMPLKCRLIADAAAGLDYAHQARSLSGRRLSLIHRDVSPQNVLVTFNGNVKLIDFGVAKAAGKLSRTVVGTIKGKHAYMSPEQARGEELDGRSDVFGLGVIFYELLTHTRLFKRENETATLKAVVGAKVAPPSELVSGLPKSLDAVVLKALARKREERFQTAGELQLAIEEFLRENKLAASAAHMTLFMRDLYSEELEDDRISDEPTVIHQAPWAQPGGEPPAAAPRSSSAAASRAPAPRAAQSPGRTRTATNPSARRDEGE